MLPRLVPSFKRAIDDAGDDLADIMVQVRSYFESIGVTAESMPAGVANLGAAERQLNLKIREREEVIGAIGVERQAKGALTTIEGQLLVPPSVASCQIPWRAAPAGIVGVVANAAGLGPAAPCRSAANFAGTQAGRVAREIGLGDCALTDVHMAVIDAITNALPAIPRPLRHATGKALEQARELLAELPATREIQAYLAATANGPIPHGTAF